MLKQAEKIIKLETVFTCGLFLGLITGTLMARKSGEETRRDLANSALRVKELAKDRLEELEDFGIHKIRKAGHSIRDAADRMCMCIDELGCKDKIFTGNENKEEFAV